MDTTSADLLARWRAGDQTAAEEIFRRYFERLLALAQSRLSGRLARRIDPEDVVQAAYCCFFLAARQGRFAFSDRGDLWRLLVSITLHKLRQSTEYHAAGKRSVSREFDLRSTGQSRADPDVVLARDPTPAEAAALADTVERALRGLGPFERRMVEFWLQGYALEEIAEATDSCERTVRRVLGRVKERLGRGLREK